MFTKICIVYLKLCLISISANYLFPEHAVIFSQPKEADHSYFGFAVQLQSSPEESGRVIVGAPKSTDIKNTEAGAVFSCNLNSGNCEKYDFESPGKSDGSDYKGKNYSCLGFSLDADETTAGRLVACAPRWVNENNNDKKTYSIPRLNGMCYYVKNATNIVQNDAQKLMPLEISGLQFNGFEYNYILGQAGFSTHLTKDSNIVLTALGLHNWTGSVIQYKNAGESDEIKYIAQPRTTAKFETYSYFGYSLASGRFNSSDLNKIYYVSGAPRSDNLNGTVFLYETLSSNIFTKRYEYPGNIFGEYFGASSAVADINGDGIDDVIIGAPTHSTKDNKETGCIYMYITMKYDKRIKTQSKEIYEGDESGSRFGTAISNIGDINKDGCEDVVVGAPYYKERGAIYLYLGQKKGVLKFVQKILASAFGTNIRGFGFSISRGADIDNNHYNDVAIGAYLSGHVIVLKSQPIVNIKPTLKPNIKQIDVNTKTFILTYCFTYETKDVPINLNIAAALKADRSQIIFDNNNNSYSREMTYEKGLTRCTNISMTIREGLMHDAKFTMTYNILHQPSETKFCKLCPIEETDKSPTIYVLPFASGCSANVCKPDLKLTAKFIDIESFILGSKREIQVHAIVENLGENSFGTKLIMHLNSVDISVKSENYCKQSNNIITCDFVRPVTTNDKREILFTLNVDNLPINEKLLKVDLLANSSSDDTDNSNNKQILELPLRTDVKYNIDVKSEPSQILMTENITSATTFIHTFTVESIGITEMDVLDVYFYIPYKYKEDIIVENILISDCSQENYEIVDAKYETDSNMLDKSIDLNCTSTQTENLKCKKFSCQIRDGTKLNTADIFINLDFNISVFREKIKLVLVTTLESNSEYVDVKSYAKTTLIGAHKAASIGIYVGIGIIAGIILIIIVGFILYKVGFFKRKRPQKPEDEALLEKKNDAEAEPGTSAKIEINDDKNDDEIKKEESDG